MDEWSDTVSRRGMLADFGERKKRKEVDFEGIEFKKENPSSIEGRKSKNRGKIFTPPPPFVNDFVTFQGGERNTLDLSTIIILV